MSAMRPYIVRQGDYLAKIAFEHGFDADELWDLAENSDLRKERASGNILCPSDIVRLPDGPACGATVRVGGGNSYVTSLPQVELRLRLRDDGEPLASAGFTVRGGGYASEGTTDDEGVARFRVPCLLAFATIEVPDKGVRFPIWIGALDCASTDSGVADRLRNLAPQGETPRSEGVNCCALHGVSDANPGDPAVMAFQSEEGVAVSGAVDDETRAKVRAAYGC